MSGVALALLPSLLILACDDDEAAGLRGAFKELHAKSRWPVLHKDGRTLDHIVSTFGPRRKASTKAYDWHRGIDIDDELGTEIVAALDGKVEAIKVYDDGGHTIVLRHEMPHPETVVYGGHNIERCFTFYMHLKEGSILVTEDQEVKAGDRIASMGMSGSGAHSPHLHFELRVGALCSLESQNFSGSHCTQFGFDPHMHPLLLFAEGEPGLSLVLKQKPTMDADGKVEIICNDDNPILNRIVVAIEMPMVSAASRPTAHVLDFNERRGFHALTNSCLDLVDRTKPYLEPRDGPFTDGTPDTFETVVIIPRRFALGRSGAIRVYDIWGRLVEATWKS